MEKGSERYGSKGVREASNSTRRWCQILTDVSFTQHLEKKENEEIWYEEFRKMTLVVLLWNKLEFKK